MFHAIKRILGVAVLAAAIQAQPLSFHRLRIEFSTTSDWTLLTLKNPEAVYSVRLMSTRNEPRQSTAAANQLALGQTLSAAQTGQAVAMTADYAVAADGIAQPLQFLLEKGSLNGSVVRVSLVAGEELRLLREVSHQVTVAGSAGRNPLEFAVDLAPLQNVSPAQAAAPSARQRLLWAFYYPWYGITSWSSPQLKDRPVPQYSSDDPEVIARQIAQAQAAGIDGFISSWWGPGHYTDRNLKTLLELAQARSFAVTIYFETLTGSPSRGRPAEELTRWLTYYISTYRDHPAIYKVNGKPLIYVWASDAVPLQTWQDVFAALRAQGLDACYLANSRNLGNLTVFDGLHEYGALKSVTAAADLARVSRATHYYHLLADTPTPKLWAPAAQPGYDDRLIPGRAGAFIDRADGAFYRQTFENAIQSEPDWISVMTWNEWWEHTYIEPGELYGDFYLKLTREYALKWKGATLNRVVSAASYLPGPVAPGEIVSLFGLGIGPEQAAGLQLDPQGRVSPAAAGAKVLIGGIPAPLLFTSTGQTNVVIPYGVSPGSNASVQVEYNGAKSNAVSVPVAAAAPAIFTMNSSGQGQGAILNEDQTFNSASQPAAQGSIIVLYATGEGLTDPAGEDGKVAKGPPPQPRLRVAVTIGGRSADVVYAGGAPEFVAGLLQVNARVPLDAPVGLAIPVVLTIDMADSQPGVTMAIGSPLLK